MTTAKRDTIPWLMGLIAVQSLCAGLFVWDALGDMGPHGLRALSNLHISTEALAALALVAGIVFETG